MSGARNLFLSASAACAACLLASCASDVPVPDDQRAKEWSPAIKSSHSSWQPPKEMPKGNPEYEKAIAQAHESRQAPVAPPPAAKKNSNAAPAPAPEVKKDPAPAPAPAPEAKKEPAPAPAPAPEAKKNTAAAPAAQKKYVVDRSAKATEYVVVKGDTLSLISKRHYKDGNLWYIVYQENKDVLKSNANKLRPGMKLQLPVLKQKSGAH